jgi:hypothetical protein
MSFSPGSPSGFGQRLDLAILIEGDDDHLAVGETEPQGGLAAVEALAAHLHAPDGADEFGLDLADDLGLPPPVADADVLDHPDALAGLESGLGWAGDHRSGPQTEW